MSADLLPCPFCGGKPWISRDGDELVLCDCGAEGPNPGLAEQWNTRADRWIPVSERLPGLGVPVLATQEGDVFKANRSDNLARAEFWVNSETYGQCAPTHWRPLPAPPEAT